MLAGAVLADLGFGGHVRTGAGVTGATTVEAIADARPPIRFCGELGSTSPASRAARRPCSPRWDRPCVNRCCDRLVERGDLRRVIRKRLGLFTTTAPRGGATDAATACCADVRAVLSTERDATPRVAALAALIYASGTMPQFDHDIPWTSAVIARAEALKAGDWGADAAANAVARTVARRSSTASSTPRRRSWRG